MGLLGMVNLVRQRLSWLTESSRTTPAVILGGSRESRMVETAIALEKQRALQRAGSPAGAEDDDCEGIQRRSLLTHELAVLRL